MNRLILGLVGSLTLTALLQGAPQSSAPVGWSLFWSDEFDGTAVNEHWNIEEGDSGSYGGALQYWTRDNVILENGVLRLVSRRESVNGFAYTSGAVTTMNRLVMGPTDFRLEVRAKIPKGQGVWPAIWTREGSMPIVDVGVELDLMEALGHQPNLLYMTQHYWNLPTHNINAACTSSGPDYSAAFHVYTLELSGGAVRWYIDGTLRCGPSSVVLPVQPSYVILNTSIGGAWPGSPDASTLFPQSFDVDYVRLYIRPPTGPAMDAVVAEWDNWFALSDWSSCGSDGLRARYEGRVRTVTTPAQNGGGTPPLSEWQLVTQVCPPPVDAIVSDWSTWSPASNWSNCVNGTQTRTERRTRTVVTPAENGGTTPLLSETRTASQACVPVDAVVSAWSAWSATANWSTCVNGTQTRTERRTRTIVAPATNGGTTPALSETRVVSQNCTAPLITAPAPSVSMGRARSGRCSVTMTASAPAGSGWSAQFMDGSSTIGYDSSAPFTWNASVSRGPHAFTVRWTANGQPLVTSAMSSSTCG